MLLVLFIGLLKVVRFNCRLKVNSLKNQSHNTRPSIAIIGGGFAGLSSGYELVRQGYSVTIFEKERYVGGLAGAFDTDGEKLDKFYHHWFTNDVHVMELISELGLEHSVVTNPTNTGLYYANSTYRLSTPFDLLKFNALPIVDRIRLGLLTLYVRRIKRWQDIEKLTAVEWLMRLGGKNVFKVVWEPLLYGKFGNFATKVSAVWFWNKIKLRGGSRGKKGEEQLAYLKGSFSRLAEELAKYVTSNGGDIKLGASIKNIDRDEGSGWIIKSDRTMMRFDKVIATTPLPITAELVKSFAPDHVSTKLQRIEYLANICLVLRLKHSLSSTYWLNVNDIDFPFVGIIEHTNFQSSDQYGGQHVVYLSKYLPHNDALYTMSDEELLDFSLPFIQKMFPKFKSDWVINANVWRARWAQPIVERNYSELIPKTNLISPNFFICSMAQIYPEDRGTNYAIREGRAAARKLIASIQEEG